MGKDSNQQNVVNAVVAILKILRPLPESTQTDILFGLLQASEENESPTPDSPAQGESE